MFNLKNKKEMYLEKVVKSKIDSALKSLRELEQNKLYYILLEDASDDDITSFKEVLNDIKRGLEWTAPNIVILNRPIKELTETELEELINIRRKL